MNKLTYSLVVLAVGGALTFAAAQSSTPTPAQPAPSLPSQPVASQPAGPGVVDPGHPRVNEVDQRLEDQKKRIAEGVRNGTLTKEEARQMLHNDARIANRERQDMAANGGHLTKQEQQNINKALNKNSKKIYNEKHGK
jgi:hypothetical protein